MLQPLAHFVQPTYSQDSRLGNVAVDVVSDDAAEGDRIMEFQEAYSLEFIGGPYDGYLQQLAIPHENLLATVALPVNRNVLQVIKGEPPGPGALTRTVAAYELQHPQGQWQYLYRGSRRASNLDWDGWCTKICQAWRQFQRQAEAGQETGDTSS